MTTSRSQPHRPYERPRTAREANRAQDVLERAVYRGTDEGHGAHDSHLGSHTDLPYPRFALFQIPYTAVWEAGSVEGDPYQWAYVTNCPIQQLTIGVDPTYTAAQDRLYETLWHITAYPGASSSGTGTPAELRAYHAATDRFPVRCGPGDYVWAHLNPLSERWEILQPYEDHWRFVLDEDVQQGGFGTASLRLANQNTATWTTTPIKFRVHDSGGYGPLSTGTKGVAKRFGDSNRWEIISLPPSSTSGVTLTQRLARGTLSSNMCEQATSGTGLNVTRIDGTAVGTIVVQNVFRLPAQAGDELGLVENQSTWEVWQVEHHARYVLTDTFFSSSGSQGNTSYTLNGLSLLTALATCEQTSSGVLVPFCADHLLEDIYLASSSGQSIDYSINGTSRLALLPGCGLPSSSGVLIPLYQRTLVDGFAKSSSGDSCNLLATTQRIIQFLPVATSGTSLTAAAMQAVQVLSDVYAGSGQQIRGLAPTIFILCATSPDDVLLIQGVICSSSGA